MAVVATPLRETSAKTATAARISEALRGLSAGWDQSPAPIASSSMMPSPMKNCGPTARFSQGKQELIRPGKFRW